MQSKVKGTDDRFYRTVIRDLAAKIAHRVPHLPSPKLLELLEGLIGSFDKPSPRSPDHDGGFAPCRSFFQRLIDHAGRGRSKPLSGVRTFETVWGSGAVVGSKVLRRGEALPGAVWHGSI